MAVTAGDILLKVDGLTKSFGGVKAVQDYSMELRRGSPGRPDRAQRRGEDHRLQPALRDHPLRQRQGELPGPGDHQPEVPPHRARLGIGRTFQNVRLFDGLSVKDNVKAACCHDACYSMLGALLGLPSARNCERSLDAKVERLLDLVGIGHVANERAKSLPYGLQRKVEIARALAINPKILLLDEPAAGLNPSEVVEMVTLIRSLHDDHRYSIFLIEHHMEVVMPICDDIYVVNMGQTIAHGTPREIQTNPGSADRLPGGVRADMFLEMKKLAVVYGKMAALHGVSLEVEEGSITSIIGANGAGKSTLLNAISGVVKYTGEVIFQGAALPQTPHQVVKTGHRPGARGPAGVLRPHRGGEPDDGRLHRARPVGAPRAGGADVRAVPHPEGAAEAAGRHPLGRRAADAGHQPGPHVRPQGAAAGRALPGAGAPGREVPLRLFQKINQQGVTIVLVEQNAKQALAIADYAYVLEVGNIVSQGTGEALLHDPVIRKAYLGATEEVCEPVGRGYAGEPPALHSLSPWERVGVREQMLILNREGCERIHGAALEVLRDVGVRVDDPDDSEAAPGGRGHGVGGEHRPHPGEPGGMGDREGSQELQVAGRGGDSYDMRAGGDTMVLTGNALYITRGKVRSDLTSEGVAELARVVDACDNIHGMVGTAVVDYPAYARDVAGFRIMAEHTRKHLRPCVFTPRGGRLMIEMAQVLLGGTPLRERPIFSTGFSILSPLHWSAMALGVFKETAGFGVPATINSEPLGGATAPVTLAGALVIGDADTLSGLVINQLLEDGRPCFYNIGFAHVIDMASAIALTGAPENALLQAAGADLAAFHGLPCASWMSTESMAADGQSALEKMITGLAHAASGVNFIWGAGNLESTLAMSPGGHRHGRRDSGLLPPLPAGDPGERRGAGAGHHQGGGPPGRLPDHGPHPDALPHVPEQGEAGGAEAPGRLGGRGLPGLRGGRPGAGEGDPGRRAGELPG